MLIVGLFKTTDDGEKEEEVGSEEEGFYICASWFLRGWGASISY